MPARSKSQQRAMAAAEHGADFPLARKLRASMTRQQLHDFASGSMKSKPEHVGGRTLHPALAERAQMVKQAHAHLSKTVPGFTARPMREQMKAHQQHIARKLGGQ